MGNVTFIYVHHTAVSHAKNPDQWEATNAFHKEMFNMKSSLGYYCGYTYEISKLGIVRQARAVGEETAAVIGHNKDSVSIALDGNFDIEDPSPMQVNALKHLLRALVSEHKIKVENIHPHRQSAPYKTCYGRRLSDGWARGLVSMTIDEMIERIAQLTAEVRRLTELLKKK